RHLELLKGCKISLAHSGPKSGRQQEYGKGHSPKSWWARGLWEEPQPPLKPGVNDEATEPGKRHTAWGVCKRSYKRALKRAALEGSTVYKGKRIRFWQPEIPYLPTQRKHNEPARLSCLTWNCSGLSTELFLELQVWLRTKPEVGFFTLQETHWSAQGEWTSGDWYILHSAAPRPKHGGVMLGIRKSLLVDDHHSWNEIVPGRLLHWRGCIGKQQYDIFNLYQHSLSQHSDEQKQLLMQNRRGVWSKLDTALSALPFRSAIVLMGDFNMVMQPHATVVGQGVHAGSQVHDLRQERSDVLEVLARHRQTALNTWGKKQYTYRHPSGSSQIDYVFVRQHQADQKAKECCVTKAPIAALEATASEAKPREHCGTSPGYGTAGPGNLASDFPVLDFGLLEGRQRKRDQILSVLAHAESADSQHQTSVNRCLLNGSQSRKQLSATVAPALQREEYLYPGQPTHDWANGKKRANPYIQAALQDIPQYAYRAQASTADPLLRASQHCHKVREMLASCTGDLTSRLAHQPVTLLLGGIMVSLDLSKAFDSSTHEEMYLARTDAGMPSNLAGMLLQIHINTKLYVVHKGQTQTAQMGRGWPQRHMSVYADDKHGFWQIHGPNDLHKARQELGLLIQVITQLGMTVNSAKSRVVIALKGSAHLRLLKQITKQWNGHKCLMVPYGDNALYIPVNDTLEFLGMKLSYGKFEVQAAQHRVQQAQLAFGQLKTPLRTNGALSQKRRIQLYKTCILPCMLYGVVSVGCTAEVVKVLSSGVARHMRKVCRVYEKGISTEQVLQQAGVDIYDDLRKLMSSQVLALQLDSARSQELLSLELRPDSYLLKNVALKCEFPCPVCGVYYGTQSGLQQHIHQRHPEVELQVAAGGNAESLLRKIEQDQKLYVPAPPVADWEQDDYAYIQAAAPKQDKANPQYKTYTALQHRRDPIQCHRNSHDTAPADPHFGPECGGKVQKDAAEYLQQLLQDCNFELKAISPFQCRYLLRCICIQLNRYLRLDQTTKLTTPVRFDSPCYHRQHEPDVGIERVHSMAEAMLSSEAPPQPSSAPLEIFHTDMDEDKASQIEESMFRNYFPAGVNLDGQSTAPPSTTGTEGEGKGSQKEEDPWSNWGRSKRAYNDGWGQSDAWGNRGGEGQDRRGRSELLEEIKDLRSSMFQLQRLALRHEDYLGALRPETSYALFLRTGVPASVVPALFKAQQAWRERKESDPDSVEKTQETMAKLGWISTEPLKWNYLKWDPKVERLRHDTAREALGYEQGIATVEAILALVRKTGPVTRFHPSRSIEEEMKGSNVTFSMQLALYGEEATQLKEHMATLTNCSITQLMALSWRPERGGRSNVANMVQKAGGGGNGGGNGYGNGGQRRR
ncbi:unnamed protein product, partial [Symbiodinium sp. CCMP2456]